MASKTDRFTRADGMTTCRGRWAGRRRAWTSSTRLEQYSKAFKPPEVKYKDLEAIVTSRIVRDQMKFNWRTDYVKVTNDTVLVPITVQVPNNQLSFNSKDGVYSATLNIFGRVSTLTGRVVQTFEDPVSRDFPESPLSAVAEAPIDLSKGCAAASRTVPAGHRDQGREERQRRRGEHAPAGSALMKMTSLKPAR